jgi:hypothetical protein
MVQDGFVVDGFEHPLGAADRVPDIGTPTWYKLVFPALRA